jgi:ribosomal-protein-alanine N-acetyltransferase
MSLAVVRTEHILLRPWTREDVDALHALWTAPEVRRYLWDDTFMTRDTAAQVVESDLLSAETRRIGCWALQIPPPTSPAAAPIAGFCGFRFIGDGPKIELMYGLQPEYWGKGLATEACQAALEYLWRSTEYQQVYARTDPPNRKSVQVLLRLGMTQESTTESAITYVLRRPLCDGRKRVLLASSAARRKPQWGSIPWIPISRRHVNLAGSSQLGKLPGRSTSPTSSDAASQSPGSATRPAAA